MPVSMVMSSMVFYIINGYLIGHYFGALKTLPYRMVIRPSLYLLAPQCLLLGSLLTLLQITF